jgi:hypothetical protein
VNDANGNGIITSGEVSLVGIITDGGDLVYTAANFAG